MNAPRVFVIIEAHPAETKMAGGSTGFIRAIIPHLPAGWTILTPEPGREAGAAPGGGDPRVQAFFGSELTPGRVPARFVFLSRVAKRLLRLRRLQSDIFYSQSNEAAFVLAVARPLLFPRVKLALHQHGAEIPLAFATYGWARRFGLPRLYDALRRFTHRRMDLVVAIDAVCFELNRRWGLEDRTIVVHNAVDTDYFSPPTEDRVALRKDLGLSAEDFFVLSAGRLEDVKRFDLLIRAFHEFVGAAPGRPSRLVLAGDGSMRASLERLAQSGPARGRIELLGPRGKAELRALYRAADAFALVSRQEGIPMVILEALAVGVPVLATAVGGIPELMNPDTGILLHGDSDPAAVCDGLLAMSARAWDRAKIVDWAEQFSAAAAVAHLDQRFRELCAARPDGRADARPYKRGE